MPISIAALYGAANLPEKAMPYLEKAFELQQITPTALKYDINLMNMQKAPGYAEAVKNSTQVNNFCKNIGKRGYAADSDGIAPFSLWVHHLIIFR